MAELIVRGAEWTHAEPLESALKTLARIGTAPAVLRLVDDVGRVRTFSVIPVVGDLQGMGAEASRG